MTSRQTLGQHFLISRTKAERIADALCILPELATVIEIGPGHGELTQEIFARIRAHESVRYIGIEKDLKLCAGLGRTFKNVRNVQFIEGDALRVLPHLVGSEQSVIRNYGLIGNLPFSITGRLLRIIGSLEPKPLRSVFTLQREVALRLTAGPPCMNLLAASVQFWAHAEIIDTISRTDFSPPPQIDAAVVRLKRREEKWKDSEAYYPFIKILFKQPRKTIANNLFEKRDRNHNRNRILKMLREKGVNPEHRPQDLSLETIKTISKLWYDKRHEAGR